MDDKKIWCPSRIRNCISVINMCKTPSKLTELPSYTFTSTEQDQLCSWKQNSKIITTFNVKGHGIKPGKGFKTLKAVEKKFKNELTDFLHKESARDNAESKIWEQNERQTDARRRDLFCSHMGKMPPPIALSQSKSAMQAHLSSLCVSVCIKPLPRHALTHLSLSSLFAN